jgi:hypothetical protein
MAVGAASMSVVACAAPGQPPLLSRPPPGEVLLAGCRNVAPDASRPAFRTDAYLTTWGSAAAEGAALGVREGLAEGGGAGVLILARMRPPDRVLGQPVVWRGDGAEEFCMQVPAPPAAVEAALRETMLALRPYGYRASERGGLHRTDFVAREHRAARWLDRFLAFSYEVRPGHTAVHVRRDIAISRQGSPYAQATSVGQLETWILTGTRDRAMR